MTMFTVLVSALVLVARISAQTCADKGTLSSRFASSLKINDANGDGFVTGDEVFADFKDNYDTDMDGCVSEKEWTDRWLTFYKFSPEFAKARLAPIVASTPGSSPSCLIKYSFFQGNTQIRIPVSGFTEGNLGTLVATCLNSTLVPNMAANCDCAGLNVSCDTDATLKSTMACTDYKMVTLFGLVCYGKGRLSDRFDKNVAVNDADGDGVVTGPEIFADFSQNYDVNNDSCVSLQEWVNRQTSYFKFGKAYATKRLADISADINVPCVINYAPYGTDASTKIPVNIFLQNNIQSLVDMCSADQDLYRTDCDCAQLSSACQRNPRMSANVACQAYLKTR